VESKNDDRHIPTKSSPESTGSMKIRLLTDTDCRAWDQYVAESSEATCYHLAGWKKVIEESFGHKTFYLLSEDQSGKITGILPMVHLKSFLFGSFMISLPYFNYGGICAQDKESYSLLFNEAARLAREAGAGYIEFRDRKSADNGLPKKESKVSMLLSLPSSEKLLWDSLGSKLRSQVKRPEKEGMYSRMGREDELDTFYEVFSENMRDLGTPVYSKTFFHNILKAFPSTSWICSIYTKGGKAVASGFLTGFKDFLEIPWASSLRAYNSSGPNMLLYWTCLKFACDSGYKVFDFGRSTPHEGTYRFKEQWGGKPHQLYWYYWMRSGEAMPQLNPHNPKFTKAIDIWKRLPVSLTRLIGPAIVKNLP
jgi:FemAB-related protein (PEP-CTERM system-associated)